MNNKCIACGMPMQKTEDYAMGDTSRDYCLHCANSDGSMHSYDEKLESLAGFIIKTQGVDKDTAKNSAKAMMKKLPAWESIN